MIKNIIFDFNGTILDDVDVSLDALNYCVIKYLDEKHILDKEYYLDHFYFPVKGFYKEIGIDFDKANADNVSNDFISYYEKNSTGCHLYEPIISLLQELKKRNIKIFLLSASYRKLLEKQLVQYGILQYFDGVIAIENKYAKGKIGAGKEYFAKHPINVNETIMIGDTAHDCEVALELGVKPILFTNGHNSRKLLSTLGYEMIDSQDEILKFL